MLEFLFKNNHIITHGLQFIAAVIGVFHIKKYKNTSATFFISILVYLFFIDVLAMYTYYCNSFSFLSFIAGTKFEANYWWYTLFFDFIAVLLFAVFYHKILIKKEHKRYVKYLSITYIIAFIVVVLNDFENLFIGTYSQIYIIEAIFILLCTTLYFIEILQSEKVLMFSKSLYFYVSITIFLWWLIVTPVVFFDKYYITEDIYFKQLKRSIYIFANIFMYSVFSIGLIVSKPEN
ncbi:hypothetical protein [Lacinutrix sp. MedPE-SW]|uniref:hypothetical protein n=1 Tax=Lacinutrix sp. MedPE-SW TaxID=1860087 RepID=UPI000913CA5A|nr:hypothetical protein [Lacinutrix sp. MedPE-SW]OIQ24021.1 MAG: hypothetical protein BM549_01550 [Lacinutrix sp. MedPE-SW]